MRVTGAVRALRTRATSDGGGIFAASSSWTARLAKGITETINAWDAERDGQCRGIEAKSRE